MIKNKIPIIYCCRDCGALICKRTALYGKGRCKICANIGKLNPVFGIRRFGKNNQSYKKGKPHCLDCNKKLTNYRSRRCEICFSDNRKGKPRTGKPRLGKNAPCYKDGRTLKTYFCRDCSKRVSCYKTKRCYKCWSKYNVGKNHQSYVHGEGNFPYPLNFSNKLKSNIRERDNFKCKKCNISEIKHKRKYGSKLTIHHIDYNKENCQEYNLVTVCKECNSKSNFNRDYWFAYYTYLLREDKD